MYAMSHFYVHVVGFISERLTSPASCPSTVCVQLNQVMSRYYPEQVRAPKRHPVNLYSTTYECKCLILLLYNALRAFMGEDDTVAISRQVYFQITAKNVSAPQSLFFSLSSFTIMRVHILQS